MKIKQNGVDITKYVTSVTWEGSSEQVSRLMSFDVANNPTDKAFNFPVPVCGDLITMSEGKRLYVGVVTARQKKTEIGEVTIESKDFLHYLIRSRYSGCFKNKTPEAITEKVCKDLNIKTTSLPNTKIHIAKLLIDSETPYAAIVKAYNHAGKKNGKYYMPVMRGTKVSVIEKWKPSGVTLYQNITDAEYNENTDGMVNQVVIYDDKGKKTGLVKNDSSIAKYGMYQDIYTKEKGVNAKTAAERMFVGITKEASLSAIGDINCISGYTVKIKDKVAGLTGTYCITHDSHTWQNGHHTMSLDIGFWKARESV